MSLSSLSLVILFFVGLAAGFIDSIAGGGGLISVPALMWAGLPSHQVLGTNKMQSSCGTLLAVWNYARGGLIEWRQVRLAAGLSFAFAMAGTWVVTHVSNDALKQIVPWLLLAIAIYALISPGFGLKRSSPKMSAAAFACVFGAVIGFYDGFFGPGTGSFWTIALLTLLGYELTRATAYTKAVNLMSNLGSLVVFALKGCVVLPAAGTMIAGQLIGARIGSGLVMKHGAGFVRRVFLTVVFALVARLLYDQWTAP